MDEYDVVLVEEKKQWWQKAAHRVFPVIKILKEIFFATCTILNRIRRNDDRKGTGGNNRRKDFRTPSIMMRIRKENQNNY